MNVRITRTGGFAGVRISAQADTGDDPELAALVRGIERDHPPEPPGTAGAAGAAEPQPEPDRFVYTIEIGERTLRVGESALTGRLEELVRRVLG